MAASMRQARRVVFMKHHASYPCCRSITTSKILRKGVVLGIYEPVEKNGAFVLSKAAEKYNSQTGGKLTALLPVVTRSLKKGKSRVLYMDDTSYTSVAVACLGKSGISYNENENLEEGRENIRNSIAGGVQQLRDAGETEVDVDPCGDAEASAEGGHLALFSYDELKVIDKRKPVVKLNIYTDHVNGQRSHYEAAWKRGCILAQAQNFARHLMESPSNRMTPSIFAARCQESLIKDNRCTVTIRDKAWMEVQKMGAFLAVTQGSDEPPAFLEIEYRGGSSNQSVIALVGKGVTFDTGGISLKPPGDMDKMRADMGGAACVVGAISAASQLNIPVNIRGFIPLCENMPSGTAIKPGDVVTAMNGKTIQVDNTDAEGRMILADALCYAETFKPQMILDMATLTGAIDVALGSAACGVYTNSTALWDILQKAGSVTGDRVWRMPLYNHYSRQVTESDLADVNNVGKYRTGGSCTGAAFLKEFVTNKNWLHLDIAGVMINKGEIPYLGKGMSGRPTRTIVEFLQKLSEKDVL